MSAKSEIRTEFLRAARSDQEKMAAASAAAGIDAPKLVRHLPAVDIGEQIGELADTLGRLMSQRPIFVNPAGIILAEDIDGVMRPMNGQWFCSWIEQWCSPERMNRHGVYVPVSMGRDLAEKVMAAGQFRIWLRMLERERRVRLPVIREDGSMQLLPKGYDDETRTWTHDLVTFEEEMSLADALRTLEKWFGSWPWKGGGSIRSNPEAAAALSVLFGRFCDAMMGQADLRPALFVFGNQQGIGKTSLARLVLAPVEGPVPSREIGDLDQFRLRIESALMSDSRIIFVDDLGKWLASKELDNLITTPDYPVRKYHTQIELKLKNSTQVVGTGVQTEISHDLARRSVVATLHLDGRVQGRVFCHEVGLDGGASDQGMCSELLSACWCLAKEAHAKGWFRALPDGRCTLAAFTRWSVLAQAMLTAAGCADPITPERIRAAAKTERDEDLLAVCEAAVEGVLDEGEVFLSYSELADLARTMGVLADFVGSPSSPKTTRRWGDAIRAVAEQGVPVPNGLVSAQGVRRKAGRGIVFTVRRGSGS